MRQPVPFGKYLLLDRISVGGMAEVFKAKSYGVEGFEKIIAIKRILPTMGEDRDFIKMFIDEAKIAGQLAHANICQIFELGRIDGSHFIAMEYIWGKDLLQIQNRLRKVKQQMPIPMGCFSIAKVLEGLDYAHRKRDPLGRPLEIVHRDCSPQNVLVSYEGEVKVIDFGIAKATSRNSRTMAGVLKGKFGYMSPEQVRGLPLDRRSDIFAIGTMLYECLTGERLFQGETDFSTLEKVRNVDIQSPRAINPAIPEVVEKIILKALAKDVDDRYQWCSEMLADLQAFLMGQDVVFTAKSMSTWIKELFATEIDRERQQLETYKRVGRDGLIGGLPSAEADRDVVSHLGEAGAPEGDATTLGGPNFEDIEHAAGAAPDVGPAPGSPASRGSKPAASDEDDGDFGEEAPTEIFGDLDAPGNNVALPAAGSPPPRAPSSVPTTKPPKPPPGRPSTQRPAEAGLVANASGQQPVVHIPPANNGPQMQAAAQPAYQQPPPVGYPTPNPSGQLAPQGYGTPPQPTHSGQMPAQMPGGTPGGMQPPQMNGLAPSNQPQAGRTVLGMQAPVLGSYGSGGYQAPPQSQPQNAPGYPYPQAYPSGQMPGYPSGPMQGYYGQSQQMSATPIDQMAQPGETKKSTLVRDIGIGVAIAALVLGGFFVVKLFILDKNDSSNATTAPSTIATVKLSMTPGVTADMFVDDKKIASVMDKNEVPVTAGNRHVVLVGPNNTKCDEKVNLEAGKTTTLKCDIAAAPIGPGSGSGVAPAVGSGAGSGSATAAAATGSAATPTTPTPAAGSDAPKTPDPATAKTADVKTTDTKASDTKVADTKDVKTDTLAKVEPKKVEAVPPPKPIPAPPRVETPPKTTPTPPKTDTKAAGDSSKGYLQVFSKPTAKILVDGVDSGMSTPISGHSLGLGPGKHKVTFVMGDDRYTFPVVIKAGATETLSKDLQ